MKHEWATFLEGGLATCVEMSTEKKKSVSIPAVTVLGMFIAPCFPIEKN